MLRMRQNKYSTKPGAVSMITVVLMSIILLVLVIGLVQIMVNEQRQSSDNELTNRAFYTAEAGLESARQYISEATDAEITALTTTSLADADCLDSGDLRGGQDPMLTGDTSYSAEVVCQKISGVGSTYVIGPEVGVNQARHYNLGTDKTSLEVKWAVKGTDSEAFRSNNDLPSSANWQVGGNRSPAAIRLQFYSFEPNESRTDLVNEFQELYLLPAGSGVSSYTIGATPTTQPVLVDCDDSVGSEQKMCSVVVDGLTGGASRRQYVSISYLYDSTTTDLTPYDSSGNVDDGLPGQLRVDSTGRVGDVYRRIQANVDVSNDAVDNLPSYTMLGNLICKTFEVTDDTADFNAINPAFDSNCYGAVAGTGGGGGGGTGVADYRNCGSGGVNPDGTCAPSVPGGGPATDPSTYSGYGINYTNTVVLPPGASVSSCRWTFGTVGTRTNNCNFGDTFFFKYPEVPACHFVTLDVVFSNSTTSRKEGWTRLPWNDDDVRPPAGSCT